MDHDGGALGFDELTKMSLFFFLPCIAQRRRKFNPNIKITDTTYENSFHDEICA